MEHQFVVRLSRWKQELPARGNNNPGLSPASRVYYLLLPRRGRSRRRFDQQLVGDFQRNNVGAPSTGNAVSGTVTFSGTATGPLYVGFYDQNTGMSMPIRSEPKRPADEPGKLLSQGSTGSNYFFFGILDQNNSAWSAVRDKSPT